MLRKASTLNGYAIQATDDELGKVKDIYFDDEKWGVRYLIVQTGSWFSRKSVLVSPYSIVRVDEADELVHVSLTLDQVKNSPDIDAHQPVSRQLEGEYSAYYGYGHYWSGPYLWGASGYPVLPLPETAGVAPLDMRPDQVAARAVDNPQDEHLRSADNISGYHMAGTDGEIGHVEDIIYDDQAWAIRYVLVDTHNWWPGGKKVLISTQWIDRIDWTDNAVQTSLTREQIKNSPEYDETSPIERDFEVRLHEYYRQPGYWD